MQTCNGDREYGEYTTKVYFRCGGRDVPHHVLLPLQACNRSGTCKNCSCVKAGNLCANCLPGRLGSCSNAPATAPPQLSPAYTAAISPPSPTPCPQRGQGLLVRPCERRFSTVCRDPSNLVAWRKVFMLPRYILANPAMGGRSHWLNLVRARIRKWKADQIPDLWANAVVITDAHTRRQNKSKKSSLRNSYGRPTPDVRSAPLRIGSTGRPSKLCPPMALSMLLPRSETRCLPNIPRLLPHPSPRIQLQLQFPSLRSTSLRS